MRTSLRTALLLAVLLVAGIAARFPEAPSRQVAPICRLPGDIAWRSNPRMHGLMTAALAGDPRAAEPYAQRIKIPPHFRLAPHSHPNEARMVCVLSGTLYFAFGEHFDAARLKRLPPGTFFTEPKDVPHYAMTGDEEVVLQRNAIGPDGTKYVEGESPSGPVARD